LNISRIQVKKNGQRESKNKTKEERMTCNVWAGNGAEKDPTKE